MAVCVTIHADGGEVYSNLSCQKVDPDTIPNNACILDSHTAIPGYYRLLITDKLDKQKTEDLLLTYGALCK